MKDRPPSFWAAIDKLRKEAVSRMRKDGYGKAKLASYEAGWDYVGDMFPRISSDMGSAAFDMANGEWRGMSKEAEADYIYEGMCDAVRAYRSVYDAAEIKEVE